MQSEIWTWIFRLVSSLCLRHYNKDNHDLVFLSSFRSTMSIVACFVCAHILTERLRRSQLLNGWEKAQILIETKYVFDFQRNLSDWSREKISAADWCEPFCSMLRPLRSPEVDLPPPGVPPGAPGARHVPRHARHVLPPVVPLRQRFQLSHHAPSSTAFFALLRRKAIKQKINLIQSWWSKQFKTFLPKFSWSFV